jgi:hypothetical protein
MLDLLQIIGALLVLAGFTASQFGRLDPRSTGYLLVNLIGSALLAMLALVGREWGFLLLEGVWAAVSATGLLRRATPEPASDRLAPPRRR